MQREDQHRVGDLWAITSYFNPVGYKSRLRNYRIFRQRLGVPLVTIEWSRDGRFELKQGDSDILLRVSGGDVMWQKERLLNMALSSVPVSCDKIAWLDGDIVFDSSNWMEEASNLLERDPLIQLFEGLIDLPRDAEIEDFIGRKVPLAGISDVARVSRRNADGVDWQPSATQPFRPWVPGVAWAARRDLLQRHGFYDACIVGSGDRVTACAAFGQFDNAIQSIKMNACRADHYLRWARAFHDDVHGSVSHVPCNVYHLWHGELADRLYAERRDRFSEFDFDPARDIAMTDKGCWRWNSDKPAMHEYVKHYFELRNEDGQSLTLKV